MSLAVSDEHPNDFIELLVLPGHPDWLFALSRNHGVYVPTSPGSGFSPNSGGQAETVPSYLSNA